MLLMFSGLGILLYPNISSWWNATLHASTIAQFQQDVEEMLTPVIYDHFRRANELNAELALLPPDYELLLGTDLASIPADYNNILYVYGTLGRLEIPVVDVDLPIFHSTCYSVLENGVGHLEGTSLPVGGPGTHSVLTAHAGRANSRLFTDLEGNLGIGDRFYITVLDRRLIYEVAEVLIIEPWEIEPLRIIPGEDIVTLLTCTPVTVNTHRLLFRGVRVDE